MEINFAVGLLSAAKIKKKKLISCGSVYFWCILLGRNRKHIKPQLLQASFHSYLFLYLLIYLVLIQSRFTAKPSG